ncbi:MAG: hypothetical protein JW785_03815 [Acidimicrobiia bacterium]|nr:hypothetical protein [Acidimicrobiia bacterium]
MDFAQMRCESGTISVEEVLTGRTAALVAPSPGFDGHELFDLIEQTLAPAGLIPTAIHFYVLGEDRVTVAVLGLKDSWDETLDSAEHTIEGIFAENGRVVPGIPVAWVIDLRVESASGSALEEALVQLGSSPYALVLTNQGTASILPPFDPSRDVSAREWADRLETTTP